MKVITIKQPWAHLIVQGIKDIENRSWRTLYRGRVLIHASSKPDKEPYKIFTNEQARIFIESDLDFNMLQSYRQNSQIIGSVEIVDCVRNHPSIWAEQNVWNWILINPVFFEMPIEHVKGCLGLWEYDISELLQ